MHAPIKPPPAVASPGGKAERRTAFVNWSVLHDGMSAAGIDALVAFSPAGTHYLSGCFNEEQVFVGHRLSIAVVPREGEPTYITSNLDEAVAKADSWLPHVRTYEYDVTSAISILADVLAESGLVTATLGLEKSFLPIAHYRELAERVPRAKLIGADSVLSRARSLKMPAEIDRMQWAVATADQAVQAAWRRCHAGDTEKEVQAKMVEELGRRGAERYYGHLVSGPELVSHHIASNRRLERGDLLSTVFCGMWGPYWSDNERFASVGSPGAVQRERYEVIRDVLNETVELIRPGVEVCELYNYPVAAHQRYGDSTRRAHMGHGMPRTPLGHEDPLIQPNVRTVLEPNMLLMLEHFYRPDGTSEQYVLSRFVQVTERGQRVLDDWDITELFVIE